MDYRKNSSGQWKSADILFLKTFEKKNLSQNMLHPPEYPLLGFRGKPIKPAGKYRCLYHSKILTMPELKHSHSTSSTCITHISRFSAEVFVIRQQFLCMKIPAPKGVITVFGDQQEARNIEKGHTPRQTNVHQLNSAEEKREPYIKAERDKEKLR
jgi:hypothetical protein